MGQSRGKKSKASRHLRDRGMTKAVSAVVVPGGFVLAAVFEGDERVAAKRHQVAEQKAIRRVNAIKVGLLLVRRPPHGMAGERQRHQPSDSSSSSSSSVALYRCWWITSLPASLPALVATGQQEVRHQVVCVGVSGFLADVA